MGGGLLNLLSYGNQNILVNGNPSKSLFVSTYKKYTNFGLQKQQINCNITIPQLSENEPTELNFTFPRFGDLIADTFLMIQMPHIWSPVWIEPSDVYDCPGAQWPHPDKVTKSPDNDCEGTIKIPLSSELKLFFTFLKDNQGFEEETKDDISSIIESSEDSITVNIKYCDPSVCSTQTCNTNNCTITDSNVISITWTSPSTDVSIDLSEFFNIKKIQGLYAINDPDGSIYYLPRKIGDSHIPYCQPFEFRWIEDLGSQIITSVAITIGGTIIQEYSGDYLLNMIKRDFSEEKKELFNEMTGNIDDLHNPAFANRRNGNYPNSLFGAPYSNVNFLTNRTEYTIYNNLTNILNKNYEHVTNLNPSIYKRLLCIPLNFWYSFSSSQAFPLISMKHNELRIKIRCRPIRELFRIRDVRKYINTYYHHNIAINNITENGSGTSIYKYYYPDYYTDPSNNAFSQFDIFKPYVPPSFISTMNTIDPLYQMYMFTTQFPSQNQQYIQQAGLRTSASANVASDLRGTSLWNINPRLIATYVYLDEDEQQVFRSRPQNYLIKQIQQHFFQTKNHKEFTQSRFKSNSLSSNWMWYLQRSDVNLRNEWSNYTNWEYKNVKPYTLQPLYHIELSNNWYKSETTPIWEPITLHHANPKPTFSQVPEFLQYLTASTEPENYRTNNYAAQYPDFSQQVNEVYFCQYLNSDGIAPGAVQIDPSMNKQPPYFPYSFIPNDISVNGLTPYQNGVNPYITGPNRLIREIPLITWGVLLDGKIREDLLDANYYNNVEPFLRSSGSSDIGLYNYSFGLNTSPFILEPNGAMNLIDYKHIDFEYNIIPLEPINDISRVSILPICGINDELLGYNKHDWNIYNYTFNLKVFEEQYNLLTISGGLAFLEFQSAH